MKEENMSDNDANFLSLSLAWPSSLVYMQVKWKRYIIIPILSVIDSL